MIDGKKRAVSLCILETDNEYLLIRCGKEKNQIIKIQEKEKSQFL